ncbi:hypothetical protein [Caldithrix abyssi]
MLSEAEATVIVKELPFDCAPFDSAQGARVRLLSEAEATVDY